MSRRFTRTARRNPAKAVLLLCVLSAAVAVGALWVAGAFAASGPPTPSITSGPANPTNLTGATFVFSAPPSGGSNQCKLDAGAFGACTSATTMVYSGLAVTSHTFQVQAVAGGKTSGAASYSWVIDQTPPTVANVTSSAANGSYKAGSVIPVTVTFSEPVAVTGTPTLALATGSPASTPVSYTSGTGSSTLTFNYTVAAGNTSADLNYVATNSLAGTIRDLAGNAASLTLPGLAAAGSLGTNKNLVIDTVAPSVSVASIVRVPPAAGPTNAGSVSWTVTFSEPVVGVAAANFQLVAAGLSGTPAVTGVVPGSGGLVWTVTASTGSGTPSGQGTLALKMASAGSTTDLAGNALTGVPSATGPAFTIDKTAPVVTLLTWPPDPSATATSTFTWSASDTGGSGVVSYLCSTENGSFTDPLQAPVPPNQPCVSPLTYVVATTNNGQHQFAVEAVDAAGNVSAAASYQWKVNKGSLQNASISGNAVGPVYPGGAAVAFATKFTNPNTVPLTVTSLTVTLVPASLPAGCLASWFTIVPSNISAGNPVVVPAAPGTVTLPTGTVSAPKIVMNNDSANAQNNCVGVPITVSYGGTFTGTFTVGAPTTLTVAFGTATYYGPNEPLYHPTGLFPTAVNDHNAAVATVPATVTNNDDAVERLHQLVYKVTTGWSVTVGTHPACTAADFSIGGEPVGAAHTVVYNDTLQPVGSAPANKVTHTVTVQLIENGHDQMSCNGAHVSLTVDAS